MITVVNKRTSKESGTVARFYVGRGQGSVLGNPFVIGRDGNRDEVIAKYQDWLGTTDAALKELMRIRDASLGQDIELECWCAPLPCHADVIKRVIEEWK